MGDRPTASPDDDRAYKVDFAPDGTVTRWRKTAEGVEATEDADYHPSIYVAAPPKPLAELRARLCADPKVLDTDLVEKRHDLHADAPEPVLEVTVERIHDVQPLAREVRGVHERGSYAPGTFRCFDVDLSPQFRYCLDRGIDPTPNGDLSMTALAVPDKPLADGDVSALRLGGGRPAPSGPSGPGERLGDTPEETLSTLSEHLARDDPDVLVVSHSAVVPLLFDAAEEAGLAAGDGVGSYGEPVADGSFRLGRRAGYRTLAGSNTFVSYGNVGYSPARYDVPGRALIDTSNSFLWYKTGLDGILYFVREAKRPVQEVAWGSIGTILTAMQTREARERDVLVPWNKWEPESFKPVGTLHQADKGGLTFSPEVGFHEDVREVDFASLYPNIMITRNVSPETVGCERHPELDTVPGIGYTICEQRGFVPDVLEPMVDYRAKIKGRLESDAYEERWERYENEAEAIKWILVSCFGYQGYRNAKFGRIEAHEAINAYARDILLTTKEMANERGWEVVHGIVDSIWLGAADPDPAPIDAVVEEVSREIGIDLEFEHAFEWICFVPRRGEGTGALNRYFGKVAGTDGDSRGDYKLRGIECRQHSTPAFVVDAQLDLIYTLDDHREPGPVCDRLAAWLRRLRAGDVAPAELLIEKRATKSAGEYDRDTHVAGALRRAKRLGVAYQAGQNIAYAVTDDGARRPEHGVRLHWEVLDGDDSGVDGPAYDPDYYERELIRAAESVVSPFGWDRGDVRRHLRESQDAGLAAFGG